MKKIEFIESKEYNHKVASSTDDKYLLLDYFIGDYWHIDFLNEAIKDLDDLRNGIKTFEQIQDPNVYWFFGNGAGYLESDSSIAHFISFDGRHESFEMPLQELLDLLREWGAFLKG